MKQEKTFRQFLRECMVLPIRLYQKFSAKLSPGHCRYYPTCSEYGRQAILKQGIFKGGILLLARILRCSPLFTGGKDPVPRFKSFPMLMEKIRRDYYRFWDR